MSNYPEHEKLKAVSDRSQVVGEFLDWLEHEKDIHLAEWTPRRLSLQPVMVRKVALLAEFFEIDEELIEKEKRAMLDECRAMHEARP